MPRWVTTLIGAASVALAAWAVVRNFEPPKPLGHDPNPHPSAVADAGPAPIAAVTDAGSLVADDAGLLLSELLLTERNDTGIGSRMPDGGAVPPLPMGVPRQVRFGVILISYAGAQPSALNGRTGTRSKQDAKALADKLYEAARVGDFHAAVQQGDPGSNDDIGRVKVGVLESAPEYVLFTLPVDGVGGPVDTPRGYWVVKRLE